MKNSSYAKSLQGKMNLSFLIIVAISVVSFMIISINQTGQTVLKTSSEYTSQLVGMVNENIESYIDTMENISQIATNSSDVRHYLFTTMASEYRDDLYGKKVIEQFGTLKDTRSDIYNIGIIGWDGRYIINDGETQTNPNANIEEMAWYRKALGAGEVITSSHVQNIVKDEYNWVVTLSQGINYPVDEKRNGVFFIDLNYSAIKNLCENINLGTKGYVYIVDETGNLVYHPKQQLIYSGLWEEEIGAVMAAQEDVIYSKDGQKLYSISKSEVSGWTVVGVSYLEDLLAGNQRIRTMYYLMAAVLIGVAMLLSMLLSDMITMPLRKLQKTMKVVANGDFDVEIAEPATGDEIADLFRSFKMMVLQIRQLIERNYQEQREKRKSELNALQAQINPHFLYNTLDSIIWMAEGGENRDVVKMTSALARLLRKSISNRNELVTLAEEVDYTKSYLTIQKMRYKDKLEYEIDIDQSVMHVEMVKLVLQPLVENAIYHGIKYLDTKGTIVITGGYEEGDVVIRIKDNGVGMTKEQLGHIFDEREVDTRKNSVGVLNVHRRIRLQYGKDYGLSFESEENVGTTVMVRLPANGVLTERRNA